jgi:hypothetical protein
MTRPPIHANAMPDHHVIDLSLRAKQIACTPQKYMSQWTKYARAGAKAVCSAMKPRCMDFVAVFNFSMSIGTQLRVEIIRI